MSDFLKNLKQLSPEEMEATKSMVANDDDFAAKFKKEIDNMDKADYEETQSIMLGTNPDNGSVPEGQQVSSSRAEAEEVSFTERIGDTAAGIASAIPFSTEIGAAVGAGIEVATGVSDSFSKSYDEGVAFGKQAKDKSSERSPTLFTGGRVLGEVATTGLAAAKAVKAVGAVSNFSKVATNVGVDVLAETARQFSDSEEKTFEALGSSAKTAATYAALGLGAGAAIGKTLGKAGSIASKSLENSVISRGVSKVVKKVDNFVASTNGRISREDYVKTIDEIPGVNEAVSVGKMAEAQSLIENRFASFNSSKRSLLKEVENKLGDRYGAAAHEVLAIEQEVLSPIKQILESQMDSLGSLSKEGKKLQKLSDSIKNVFRGEKTPITNDLGEVIGFDHAVKPLRVSDMDRTLLELENLLDSKKKVLKLVKRGGGSKENMLGSLRDAKNAIRDANYDDLPPEMQSRLGFLKDVDARIEVLHHAKNMTNDVKAQMAKIESGSMSSEIIEAANSVLTGGGLVGQGLAGFAAFKIAGPAGAAAVPLAVFAKNLANSPRLIGKVDSALNGSDLLEGQVAKIANIGKFYVSGSGGRSAYYGSLMSRLSTSIADNDGETENLVSALDSTQALLKNPLIRETNDFMKKKEAITDILKVESPATLELLDDALKNNEEIGPIMDQISKIPAAKEIMQDGLGWDGRVYSEEDKATLEQGVADQPLISASSKMEMISQLRQGGIIPDLDSAPKRQPKKYRKKINKRPY